MHSISVIFNHYHIENCGDPFIHTTVIPPNKLNSCKLAGSVIHSFSEHAVTRACLHHPAAQHPMIQSTERTLMLWHLPLATPHHLNALWLLRCTIFSSALQFSSSPILSSFGAIYKKFHSNYSISLSVFLFSLSMSTHGN